MSTGAWNCTDEMYNAMEEACAASATGTRSKHSVGPYLCSPRCRALLTGTLANCIVPVARWPETAAFAQLLDLHYVAADKDTGTDGATSDARDETMTLDVVEMVQVRHKYSRHDSRDAIIIPDPTHPPGDIDMQQHSMPPCPPGILGRCFQLTSLDEIYVLFDVAPLVEGRYTITGASVRVSAFVVNHAEQLSEEVAYQQSNIQLSKCEAEPIKSLVQASKNGKSWHKAVAGMSHHCSPVCAEASVFGPTTFDISYFPDEAPTTKGSTHLGLRLTSDSQVPLNYAALRLEVTVTKNHDRYHLALAGARTPSCPCPCPCPCPCSGPCLSLSSGGALLTPLCVLCPACGFLLDHRRPTEPCLNAYLAAACLMHDSLDESSNQAVSQVARGMDVTLDTGCPGAWSGQSAEQLKSLEQTHCEYLSLTTGHPVSWPTCCNGGPDDSCTYPPPRSTTAELCAACPVGTQSYVDGGGRWFDKA